MRPNQHKDAERALDAAQGAFTRAAAALTMEHRMAERDGFLVTAILEGAYAMMKLAQGDLGERGLEKATEYLKELRKGTP